MLNKIIFKYQRVKLKIFIAQFATKNYRKIIVSWAFRDNFDKEGTYKDKFSIQNLIMMKIIFFGS